MTTLLEPARVATTEIAAGPAAVQKRDGHDRALVQLRFLRVECGFLRMMSGRRTPIMDA